MKQASVGTKANKMTPPHCAIGTSLMAKFRVGWYDFAALALKRFSRRLPMNDTK